MEKTPNLQLNKPSLDDRVKVHDLNQNADSTDIEVTKLQAEMKTKAPVDSPKFSGMVLAPRPGTENDGADAIVEQVITTGYLSNTLEVENLDKVNAMRSIFIND